MEKVVLHVKGLEQSAYDSRAGISMSLAYATSDIGAHHTRAWTIAKELEEGKDWKDEEKVDLVIYHQTLRPLFDMLGVCRLPWIELGLNEEQMVNALGIAVTQACGCRASFTEKVCRVWHAEQAPMLPSKLMRPVP